MKCRWDSELQDEKQKFGPNVVYGALGGANVQIMGVFCRYSSLGGHCSVSRKGSVWNYQRRFTHLSCSRLPSFREKYPAEKKLWIFVQMYSQAKIHKFIVIQQWCLHSCTPLTSDHRQKISADEAYLTWRSFKKNYLDHFGHTGPWGERL